MKKTIFLILIIVLLAILVRGGGGDYMDYVSIGQGNTLWCQLTGCKMKGDINMDNNSIINVQWVNATYTNITINYTQLSDEHWINESGDTMTGNLNMSGNDLIIDDNFIINMQGTNPIIRFDTANDALTYDIASDYLELIIGGSSAFGIYGVGGASSFYSNLNLQGYNLKFPQ